MLRDEQEYEQQRLADDTADQRGQEIAGAARSFVVVGPAAHGELVTLEELFDPLVADFIVIVPRKRPGRWLRPRRGLGPSSEQPRFGRSLDWAADLCGVGIIRRLVHIRSAGLDLDEPVLGVELTADLVQSLTRSLIRLGINGHRRLRS